MSSKLTEPKACSTLRHGHLTHSSDATCPGKTPWYSWLSTDVNKENFHPPVRSNEKTNKFGLPFLGKMTMRWCFIKYITSPKLIKLYIWTTYSFLYVSHTSKLIKNQKKQTKNNQSQSSQFLYLQLPHPANQKNLVIDIKVLFNHVILSYPHSKSKLWSSPTFALASAHSDTSHGPKFDMWIRCIYLSAAYAPLWTSYSISDRTALSYIFTWCTERKSVYSRR